MNRNARTAVSVGMLAVGMLALGYASVPLYRIFCQVTGFNGTTQRVDEAQAATVIPTGKQISIRFDGNVDPDLPWNFRPEQTTDRVTIGARDMAVFLAKNTSDHPVTGVASFNVEPEYTGKYFNKIQCFCFSEQTLQPGEEVRMPVLYYVDPELLKDDDAKAVEQITLSYTFHRKVEEGS
ncbi:MAG: cytochrome c oxidase assembly protein [Novosphingobium sp.]|nr:cytochrome c oxidase assembly protein [Novosphingobium sp.]